ncbi:MAG: hypothetical protein LBU64_00370 [Planctomycetota bacterium]|jgi:hypothetical protein|nr:hypothetical protein [Planctomycetota bacterium]
MRIARKPCPTSAAGSGIEAAGGGRRRPGRLFAGILILLGLAWSPGCSEAAGGGRGLNQSLLEIGELSLEQAEKLEARGKSGEANILYRRALWAFRYHERLTGEQPFLLDDARDGARRTKGPIPK